MSVSAATGYVSPRAHKSFPREYSEATQGTIQALESGENPEVAEAGLSLAIYSDMKEGFGYLRQQPWFWRWATHAILMASIVSSNIVVVALANDILHSGALGFGFIEAVWAVGAITGGLITSQLPQKIRLPLYVAVMAGLALGHMAVPYVTFLVGAACCRAVSGFFARSGESWRSPHSWRLCHATSWGVRNRHSLFLLRFCSSR